MMSYGCLLPVEEKNMYLKEITDLAEDITKQAVKNC